MGTLKTQMFAKITQQDPAFMKDLVADDYFSINADGTTVDKAQLLAQKGGPQQKMMAAATYKVFDKEVRAYGNVGIITGRARAYDERHVPSGILVHGCVRQTERQVDVYFMAGNSFKGFSATSANAERRAVTPLGMCSISLAGPADAVPGTYLRHRP